METRSKKYKVHLENKYLSGRRLYLHYFAYPKYIREFTDGEIWDFGCGLGEFLIYCHKNKRKAYGIDSNPYFVKECQARGLNVQLDDITNLKTISYKIKNVICDNVLEHLDLDRIHAFFVNMKKIMLPDGVLLVVVPGWKGFLRDPTHKTFVDKDLMKNICIEDAVKLDKLYYYPFNIEVTGKYFYLNMSVYKLVF